MPRGGHRGGLFPVSGLPWGISGRYKKRGIYHMNREDIFTPRWGYRHENYNPSPLPDGSAKSWEPDAGRAWPRTDFGRLATMYKENESRYLRPAIAASDPIVKEYLLNMLEPSNGNRRTFSGIGLPDINRSHHNEASLGEIMSSSLCPIHLVQVMQEIQKEGNSKLPIISSNRLFRGRIKRLDGLVKEADVWRNREGVMFGKRNPFPYVDESASLVRDLSLPEVLFSRSNHRISNRRHPIWMHWQYVMNKTKIPYLYRRRRAREEAQSRELGIWRGQISED